MRAFKGREPGQGQVLEPCRVNRHLIAKCRGSFIAQKAGYGEARIKCSLAVPEQGQYPSR